MGLTVGGSDVDLGPPKQRCVLAILLLSAGHSVPVDSLVSRVWGEQAPRASNAVAPYVARLRRAIGDAGSRAGGPSLGTLSYVSGGYRLTCDPALIDLHRARRAVTAARAAAHAGDDERAISLLSDTLSGWHAQTLAGLPGEWAGRMRESLRSERADLLAHWAESRLRLGDAAAPIEVIEELRPVVADEPVAERLTAALMTAFATTGQVYDALDCYARLRAAVAERFGGEPSAALRDLHVRLLRSQAARPAVAAPPSPPRIVPAQLPADVSGFTGRDVELARLDELLTTRGPVVGVVHGAGGIGKTTLAVHWAHRVAEQFPDGQLYVNLRGFAPDGRQTTAAEAIRGFLDALDVPVARMPAGVDAQAGLYRSLLAGRRMLVLLDNARDTEQVRPLLPGTTAALTLVTSRDHLTPLVATAGARPVALGALSPGEGRELLTRRVGAERAAAEPDAIAAISDACAGLPLALAIAAARAQATTFALAPVAAELRDTGRLLDALDAGDRSSQLRAVFDSSYAATAAPAARLFRLLGLHPGADISATAAAALAGQSLPETLPMLTALVRASQLTESAPGRYTMHDLLRTYAADLERRRHDDAHRRAALTRLLDHYVHTAYAATMLLDPHRPAITVPLRAPSAGSEPAAPADDAAAMAWLTADLHVLLDALTLADTAGLDTHVWQLAWSLDTFLNRRGYWADRTVAWRMALAAAYRLGIVEAQAHAHRLLAHTHTLTGMQADATRHYRRALDLYARLGDESGQAFTHRNLAQLAVRQGDPAQALRHATVALSLFERTGNLRGQALSRNAVGWYHVLLGEPNLAIDHCGRSLTLSEQLADRVGQADALDSLGHAHHDAGRHAEAIDCFERALTLLRALGDHNEEADTLVRLGDAHVGNGAPAAALAAWEQALSIMTTVGHTDTAALRARIDGLRP